MTDKGRHFTAKCLSFCFGEGVRLQRIVFVFSTAGIQKNQKKLDKGIRLCYYPYVNLTNE